MALTKRQKAEILKDYDNGNGMSNSQLAVKYGVTNPTIRNWLIRLGVYVPQRRAYVRATDVKSVSYLKDDLKRMKEALFRIMEWELPESDKYWPNSKNKMSFRAAYGANEEIAYMRNIAKDGLGRLIHEPKDEVPHDC